MKQLRDGSQEKILNELDRGIFSRHHFEIKFNQDNGILITITFRDKTEFYFRIIQPQSIENDTTQWVSKESPGEYFTSEEVFTHRDFPTAYGRVRSWTIRIIEELAVSAVNNSTWILLLRENVDKAAESLKNPELPFSEDEIDVWSKKFDDLVDRLQKLEQENKIQKGSVNKLKRQLDELKSNGSKTPKRTWLKAAGHKVVDLFEHGAKSGLKAIAEGAVKGFIEQ